MDEREVASMKKMVALALVLVFVLAALPALGQGARYNAVATVDFQLRAKPEEGARRMRLVAEDTKVMVLEAGEEWCKITVEYHTGYARTRWLAKFRALDPAYEIPGALTQSGILTLKTPARVAVPGYTGNQLRPGHVVAVHQVQGDRALLHMHRDVAALPVQEAGFTPFVPWQEAQEGDLLYAFTTYYNGETGGRLAANQAFNIEKAAGLLENLVVPRDGAFSFNQVCAPYLKSKGYRLAPIIGGNGKGYGGGVCQLSTTLYNAALGLPLRIDKWEVHRKRGVEYVPQHFDATVGLYSDLAFTNLLPYAIRLEVRPQNGALTVLIYRAPEAGQARAK